MEYAGIEPCPTGGKPLVLGVHLAVDLYDCPPAFLADRDKVRDAMVQAAVASGATVVTETFHQFNPHGISGVVVIAESHLAIHTWPEHGYAAVDLFTCGDSVKPWLAVEALRHSFGAGHVETVERGRGLLARFGQGGVEVVR